MKKSRLVFGCLSVLMLCQGCAATTKSRIAFYEETFKDDREALVYLYRVSSMVGGTVSWKVRVDNQVVGILKQGAYMVLRVSPGAHSVTIGDSAPGLTGVIAESIAQNPEAFVAKEHQTYYIRSGGFKVAFETKEKAMIELRSMKYDMGK